MIDYRIITLGFYQLHYISSNVESETRKINYLCLIFRISEDGSIIFGGWARMAQPIIAFSVVEVSLFFFLSSDIQLTLIFF